MEKFVHLHLHTQYSLLDGAIRLNDLMDRAINYQMPAVTMTDHGNMFGAIDFYERALKNGLKPIIGCELYYAPLGRFDKTNGSPIHHLIALCKNNTGYQNLMKLVSKGYLEGMYYKPRIDFELLKQYGEGLIITSACLKGEIPYNLIQGNNKSAVLALNRLKELFKDDFYLEIQENGISEQTTANKELIQLAQRYSIPLVATNDCHYLEREDALAQEVLMCIQMAKTLDDENRLRMQTDQFYFKSPAEMWESFNYITEACANTVDIANKCNINLKWTDERGMTVYKLPEYRVDTEASEYFRKKVNEGLEERFKGPHFKKLVKNDDWGSTKQKYLERMNYEITMIEKMGFVGYFLIVADFINWAKDNNIAVGPGRGSGVGSLAAYSLKITDIDPLPFNLLFERFINPERISMPDFDIDFCQSRRGEVIEYVNKKYGIENVGQIVTFGTLQAKAALKDVSRVFGVSFNDADTLSKMIPEELGITLQRALDLEPKIKEWMEKDPKINQVVKIAKRLEGLLRHASVHAAGIVITDRPLVEFCPLMKGKDGEVVIQYDKNFAEHIGLVKFDFLGLKTLTVINNATNLIKAINCDFDIEHIDLEDKDVYDFISRGETTGVFQLESSGMIELCKRVKPSSLEDVTSVNALYRPGPLESGMVDDFVDRKHGRKNVTYLFPELEETLKDTYGVIVYQEQVMNIARVIAGYTLAQADILRRAMGKKKPEEMEHHRSIFIEGARAKGHDVKMANDLYELMVGFAAYGFNKSHAVAYAFIAYRTAYLKLYYTPQFFAALLSSEINDKDKIAIYIGEARRYNVKVLPPDVNTSNVFFSVEGPSIRFGLCAIKNVGESYATEIIKERERKGLFKGIFDFCARMQKVNKKSLEGLVLVGAFDKCDNNLNRRTIFNSLTQIIRYAQERQKEQEAGMVSLFELVGHGEMLLGENVIRKNLEIEDDEEFKDQEILEYENQYLGVYISGHPLEPYRPMLSKLNAIGLLKNGGGRVTIAGMISDLKVFITKKGDKMCRFKLEDFTGKCDVIVFPKNYTAFEPLAQERLFIVNGNISIEDGAPKILADKVSILSEELAKQFKIIRFYLQVDKLEENALDVLKRVILEHRGAVPVEIIFTSKDGQARMKLGDNYMVTPSAAFLSKTANLFGEKCLDLVKEG